MSKRVVLWSVAVTVSTVLAIRLVGQTASPERQLVLRAAEALGGLDRVMALKTLQIIGYGELAYMNGGGNITADPDAPQKKKGWFRRMFSKDEAEPTNEYQIVLKGNETATRVDVLTKEGAPEQSRTSERILTLLYDQLK